MNILVLAPMKEECEYFKLAIIKFLKENELKHRYFIKNIGVGKASAAAETVLALNNVSVTIPYDLIFLIGYAAATKAFPKGSFVFPDKTMYHDTPHSNAELFQDLTKSYELQGSDKNTTILTGDQFVTKELAEKLITQYGNRLLFDMEAAAVCQICQDTEIPVLVMKMISDNPEEDNLESFEDFVKTHSDFSAFVYFTETLG